MKGKMFALVVTALAFLLVSSVYSNAEFVSDRETVTVTGGVCDIDTYTDDNIYSPAGGAGSNVTGNLTLPCKISELDDVNLSVYNGEVSAITVNFTVNGVKLFDNVSVSAGETVYRNLSNYTTLGGDVNLTYFAWSGNCSDVDDEYFNITIVADDAEIYPIDDFVTVTEEVETTPHIEMDKDDTWYSVTDRITFDNNCDVDIKNVTVTFTYPYQALNPSDTNVTFSSVVSSESEYENVYYQKQGPYVKTIGSPSKNSFGEYELNMRIKAYEDEDNVTWTIDPTSSEWRDYFPSLDTNTLEIYINDEEVDFTTGSINIEDIELEDGLNDVSMKWTPASQPITPTPSAEGGEDIYIFLGIAVIIVAIIAVVWLTHKE